MRALLALALLAGMLPALASADHDGRWRWYRETVPLIDRTSHMGGYVAEKGAEWNAAADGAVAYAYQDGEAAIDCAGVQKIDGAVVVCNVRHLLECEGKTDRLGCTTLWFKETPDGRRKLTAAKVVLADVPGQPRNGCHELGHAVGLQHWDGDPGSCMTSDVFFVDHPGAHDAAALARMYR